MRKAGDNIPCLPWSLTPRWPHHSVQLRNIDASTSAASRRGAFIDLVAETGTTLRSSEHIHNHPTQGERTHPGGCRCGHGGESTEMCSPFQHQRRLLRAAVTPCVRECGAARKVASCVRVYCAPACFCRCIGDTPLRAPWGALEWRDERACMGGHEKGEGEGAERKKMENRLIPRRGSAERHRREARQRQLYLSNRGG